MESAHDGGAVSQLQFDPARRSAKTWRWDELGCDWLGLTPRVSGLPSTFWAWTILVVSRKAANNTVFFVFLLGQSTREVRESLDFN